MKIGHSSHARSALSSRRRSEGGVTLVDCVIAVAICALSAVACIGCIIYGFYTMDNVRDNQRATQILLQQTEMLRLYTWSQVTSNGFIPSTFTASYDPTMSTHQGVTFYGTVTESIPPAFNPSFSPSYANNLAQFTFTLRWTNRLAHVRSVTTYVAQDGMQNYVY